MLVSVQINECCLGAMFYINMCNQSASVNDDHQQSNMNSATTSINTENNQFIINNIEEVKTKEYYSNLLNPNKEDKITYMSLNI